MILRDRVCYLSDFGYIYSERNFQRFRWAIAVILRQAPPREHVKYFFVFALVDRETRDLEEAEGKIWRNLPAARLQHVRCRHTACTASHVAASSTKRHS